MSDSKQINYLVNPGGKLQGEIHIPGDKSISHRAVMLAAIAEGQTIINGFLPGEDTLATMNAFKAMGVNIESAGNNQLKVYGAGMHGLSAPAAPLYLGNSGTSVRLLCGLLAGQRFDSELLGDESLMKRPMQRIIDPLSQMNAQVTGSDTGTLPIKITGGQSLTGIKYKLPVASAQVKSCLLLAGLYAKGKTCITEPMKSRDHTERMLRHFGYTIEHDNNQVNLEGGGKIIANDITVPGDISSAAFFMVGASIAEGSDISLQQVGLNPTRHAIIEIL